MLIKFNYGAMTEHQLTAIVAGQTKGRIYRGARLVIAAKLSKNCMKFLTVKELYEIFDSRHQNEKMSLKLLFVSLKVLFVIQFLCCLADLDNFVTSV